MAERDKLLVGMVVELGYLWKEEADQGHDRALKRRPCVIVEAVADRDGVRVGVVPITHNPPNDKYMTDVPSAYMKQAGLDGKSCSVVLNEMNRFKWPNAEPDCKMVVRGVLPSAYFKDKILDYVRTYYAGKSLAIVDRDEIQRRIVDDYREQEPQR